ncbi:unnamed protein product [Spirodela intermedia]|uniref:Uncharacterized protein n=1 Tax=Spirodela intermedia TaxID=51605 RepID=A0A7I8JRV9_SPIIN|nr:unnamed protein product [Spirodela intermedia]CAA6672920.1 unnamed protein product [Spirodela intermedia]
MDGGVGLSGDASGSHRRLLMEPENLCKHHKHHPRDNQCSSVVVDHIRVPVHVVWSLVRRFDQPQKYKPFVSRCVVRGDLEIGSVREINVKSGLPATTSTERLELLDDDEHVLGIRILGGDHRLQNKNLTRPFHVSTRSLLLPVHRRTTRSVVTLHPEIIEGRPGTTVVESFVVDVPDGNTKDETCFFVEAVIKCNLKSLADVCERLHAQQGT